MQTIYITGTDNRTFATTLILTESFYQSSGNQIHVCDFGLNDDQKRLISAHAHLLNMPSEFSKNIHPWKLKASLDSFLAHSNILFDALVWIDSDILILPEFYSRFHDQIIGLNKSGNSVSAAPAANGKSLGSFSESWEQDGQDMSFFKAELAKNKVDPSLPYLNSGLFICLGKTLLLEWHRLCWRSPETVLFEQNAFNIVAYASNGFAPLTRQHWNPHGLDLGKILNPKGTEEKFFIEDKEAYAVHATSAKEMYQEWIPADWSADNESYHAVLKLFKHPQLRALQVRHFESAISKTDPSLLKAFLVKEKKFKE